jgi:hypothetical protein
MPYIGNMHADTKENFRYTGTIRDEEVRGGGINLKLKKTVRKKLIARKTYRFKKNSLIASGKKSVCL